MDCISQETLIALLGDEVESKEATEILAHLRRCARCRKAVRELAALRRGLSVLLERQACPTGTELLEYAQGGLEPSRRRGIDEHIKECLRCSVTVGDLLAVPQDVENWLVERFVELAKKAAQTVAEAIQGKIDDRFARLWQRAESLVRRPAGTGAWNSVLSRQEVAGALGAGGVDPQTVMLLVAMIVCLTVAHDVALEVVSRDEKALRRAIQQRAREFGAGSGLTRRLCEVLPSMFLKAP